MYVFLTALMQGCLNKSALIKTLKDPTQFSFNDAVFINPNAEPSAIRCKISRVERNSLAQNKQAEKSCKGRFEFGFGDFNGRDLAPPPADCRSLQRDSAVCHCLSC